MSKGFDVDAWIAQAKANGCEVTEGPRPQMPLLPLTKAALAEPLKRNKTAGLNCIGPQTAIFNEVLLWCRALKREEPVANFKFHFDRKWELDIAFPSLKIAIELQGGYHGGVGHALQYKAENDFDKADAARRLGWTIRFFTHRQAKKQIFGWLEEEFERIKG